MSSVLIFELIEALEVKASMLFNLDFVSSTILSRFFFFFLIIDLYFLIPTVVTQIFNSTAELVIPIGISTNEAKVNMEPLSISVEI